MAPWHDSTRSAARVKCQQRQQQRSSTTLAGWAAHVVVLLLLQAWAIRIGVHFGLFHSAINGSATDEQKAKWSKDIAEMRIIGCFAMTEVSMDRRTCTRLHGPPHMRFSSIGQR